MTRADDHARLIGRLAQDLQPVGRLAPPGQRALTWLAIAVALGLLLATLAQPGALLQRMAMRPEIGVAMLGSALTAALAAWAAFLAAVPGRDARWGLLPLPGLLLWVAASGLGCLGQSLGPAAPPASLDQAVMECVPFIAMVSLPLSLAIGLMLRRGFSTRPGQTGLLAGLAVAAAAATLLNFFHPFDVTAIDLLAHGVSVGLIALGGGVFGRWLGWR
ncbi:NrsF family protein [Roseomonas sp. 18066]|uniref:NrsF family protein n=1 Tax=Roseomonas sp. 18066 TaxID=2681412 RepID=UPI00135CD7AA|nr:NrsF family protein [Roseomonas sp. 18066]